MVYKPILAFRRQSCLQEDEGPASQADGGRDEQIPVHIVWNGKPGHSRRELEQKQSQHTQRLPVRHATTQSICPGQRSC